MDSFYPSMTESTELPVMPSTVKPEDLLLRGPALAPWNEDPFQELVPHFNKIPLTDPRGATAIPSRQLPSMQQPSAEDQRSKSATYRAFANQHGSRLPPLQSSLGIFRLTLPIPTTAVNYVDLRRYGVKANCSDPLVLPELPQLPPMSSSPFIPFDSGLPPPVPPKSGYNMLPLRTLALKPPPVPPKDNTNSLTHGALRSVNVLRPHLINYPYPQLGARYPHKPLPPILDYDEVEDLALDPEERQNANGPFFKPVHHWPLPMERFSGPSTAIVASSEGVDMNSLPSRSSARSKCLPNRCHCECHKNILSDPATADNAKTPRKRANKKDQADVRARTKATVKACKKSTKMKKGDAARLTAMANAGKSN